MNMVDESRCVEKKTCVEILLPSSYNKREVAKVIARSIWKRMIEEKNSDGKAHRRLCAGQ
jgi:hypothetical protein